MGGGVLAVSTHFGPYELLDLIGRGGMGEVWRAADGSSGGRVVALKILPADLAESDEFTARFRREAEAAGRLVNPHNVPVHGSGELEGRLFIDMRLVNGIDLHSLIRRAGPLDPARAVLIVEHIADALDEAHAIGLVHRDVKPSNILVSEKNGSDFAYLIDFGIAHFAGATRITATGLTPGTVAYMAPEIFEGIETDSRVDVYALGCVLFEIVTGVPAVEGANVAQILHSHIHQAPPSPSHHRRALAPLDQVVATAMAKRPGDRFNRPVDLAAAARRALLSTGTYTASESSPGRRTSLPHDTRRQTDVGTTTLDARARADPADGFGDGLGAGSAVEGKGTDSHRRTRFLFIALVLAVVVSIGTAAALRVGMAPNETTQVPPSGSPRVLTVFSTAALADPLRTLKARFEADHAGTMVDLQFAGSRDLVKRVQSGAPADVLVTSDDIVIKPVVDAGLATESPTVAATNVLQIAVPPGNPRQIFGMSDLLRPGMRTAVCVPQIPCGAAFESMREKSGLELAPTVTKPDVRSMLEAVTEGQADAGLVFASDVSATKGAVNGIPFREAGVAPITYPLLLPRRSQNLDLAGQFRDLVTSPLGVSTLRASGYNTG